MDLKGKRCVVTGASSGIGLASALALAKRGARVLAVARNVGPIEAAGQEGLIAFSADLSSPAAVDELFERAKEALGGIDVFFANAGFAYCERSDSPDWKRLEDIFALNVISPAYSLEKLRAEKGDEPFYFLTTASAMSFMALPGYAAYGATKAAVRMFNLTASYELGEGQKIGTLYPVATRTKFFDRAATEYVPWPAQDAETVAEAVVRGIRRGAVSIFPLGFFKLINAVFSLFPALRRAYLGVQWKKTGLVQKESNTRAREEERRDGAEAGQWLSSPESEEVRVRALPAPWTLKGKGYILLYKFPKDFLAEKGYLPQGAALKGGFGAVMIVDYHDSDAGPYSELLFMPGKLALNGGSWHRITKIYVSTDDSVLNGRKNWAIPKEKADFLFIAQGREERVSISRGGVPFFAARLKPWGIHLPVSTKFLPFPLLQEDGEGYLQTSFSGRGLGRLARLEEISSLQDYFPDLSGQKPLLALRVEPFRIVFPKARRVEKAKA